MNIFQKLFPSLFQAKAVPFPIGQTLYYLNGTVTASADNKKSYLDNGYDVNDIIYSIIQLIIEKGRVAPWGVYQVKDEGALKLYNALMSKKSFTGEDYIKARGYKKKALVPYHNDNFLTNLIDQPNEDQTFSDLFADSSIFKIALGDRMLWANRLSAGADKGKPTELSILPSHFMSILVGNTLPLKIGKYQFNVGGQILTIDKEDVLHDKYYNPNYDINGSHLLGLSPLKPAHNLTDRSNAENMIATSSYQNGGPRSIIFVDEPGGFEAVQKGQQAAAIKKILTSNEYIGPENVNKLAASGYKMGAIPVGLSPVDLDIIESEKWSLRRFCNVFGAVPSQLLNDPDNKVYNNTVEGEKALTTRCVLPLLIAFRNKVNQKFQTDWGYKGKNVFVDFDMNVYTELQEDLGKKWTYVKELPTTNRRKLEMMGEDAPDGHDDFMDQILIPSGYELSDTFTESETDRALAEGDGEMAEESRGEELQKRAKHNGSVKV